MRRIILITGGERSGKSHYAEQLAKSLTTHPVYIATARAWDDEFRRRIAHHQAERGPEWTNIEADLDLATLDIAGRVAVIDCLTLFTTNYYFDCQGRPIETVLQKVKAQLDAFTRQDATMIFVTNEIGMGGVAPDKVQRRFTDLLGWVNQYAAQIADEVVLMVCGVAVKVKTSPKGGGLTNGKTETVRLPSPLGGSGGAGREALQAKIDNLNKPRGSMGTLEALALQIGLLQQTLSPTLSHPCHLLLGADHGIEREGVSVSPRDVTWQQMINFTRGGGGVNMFCRQHGFDLTIVDVGVDHDLAAYPAIRPMKVAAGTHDFLHEPAMSEEEMDRCLAIGRQLADECEAKGSNIIAIGEMGIGNTSPSSIWMSLLLHIPLSQCVGAGAGLDNAGIRHKLDVLERSVARTAGQTLSPRDVMREYGGFEMVAAVGAMLRAAERRMVILVDGFIMTACALMASRLAPESLDAMVFCHEGDESGHRLMLEGLNRKGLLHLGLRLGEGTGALCAYPIVESAIRMINEMNNFDNAHITKYF